MRGSVRGLRTEAVNVETASHPRVGIRAPDDVIGGSSTWVYPSQNGHTHLLDRGPKRENRMFPITTHVFAGGMLAIMHVNTKYTTVISYRLRNPGLMTAG